MRFQARDVAAPDTSAQLLWVLRHVQEQSSLGESSVLRFLFIFKEKKITLKLQLNRVFDVVLMYRINKLCSDVGIYLLQHYAW